MTIGELLECARVNLVDNAGRIPVAIGAAQLDEAIGLLNSGLTIDDETDATPPEES